MTFTDQGIEKLEERCRATGMLKGEILYDIENVALVHHLNSALRAHKMFQRDKDYIVRNDEVVIIDEFTGRMMPGRRYSEGLHQALEAKEHVKINAENQTLASITFQNYFRLYKKLAGMTGTAATEAEEFGDIYGLERRHHPDQRAGHAQGRGRRHLPHRGRKVRRDRRADQGLPQSAASRCWSARPRSRSRKCWPSCCARRASTNMQVLNARYHEQEAEIIADAGMPGAITIATNMAGRGTDIQLGGNLDMRIANGDRGSRGRRARQQDRARSRRPIAVDKEKAHRRRRARWSIGTERHESRRIDNQLRGRSGRQGDPGHSKFFLSLQDDLMRIFPVESMDSMLGKLGLEQGESITHPWVTKAIERAQARVEARNFDIRKNILKYDDVMNDQRKVIFEQRIELMDAEDVSETITDMRHDVVDVDHRTRPFPTRSYPEQWNVEQLEAAAKTYLNVDVPIKAWADEEGIDVETRARAPGQGRRRSRRRQGSASSSSSTMPASPTRRHARRSRSRSCCSRSTACGAITW